MTRSTEISFISLTGPWNTMKRNQAFINKVEGSPKAQHNKRHLHSFSPNLWPENRILFKSCHIFQHVKADQALHAVSACAKTIICATGFGIQEGSVLTTNKGFTAMNPYLLTLMCRVIPEEIPFLFTNDSTTFFTETHTRQNNTNWDTHTYELTSTMLQPHTQQVAAEVNIAPLIYKVQCTMMRRPLNSCSTWSCITVH